MQNQDFLSFINIENLTLRIQFPVASGDIRTANQGLKDLNSTSYSVCDLGKPFICFMPQFSYKSKGNNSLTKIKCDSIHKIMLKPKKLDDD